MLFLLLSSALAADLRLDHAVDVWARCSVNALVHEGSRGSVTGLFGAALDDDFRVGMAVEGYVAKSHPLWERRAIVRRVDFTAVGGWTPPSERRWAPFAEAELGVSSRRYWLTDDFGKVFAAARGVPTAGLAGGIAWSVDMPRMQFGQQPVEQGWFFARLALRRDVRSTQLHRDAQTARLAPWSVALSFGVGGRTSLTELRR